jgi:hypothetical protein
MRNLTSIFCGIILIIIVFSLLIHPTLYYYTTTEFNGNSYVIKVNRVTGSAYTLYPLGWSEMSNE